MQLHVRLQQLVKSTHLNPIKHRLSTGIMTCSGLYKYSLLEFCHIFFLELQPKTEMDLIRNIYHELTQGSPGDKQCCISIKHST